MAGHHHIVPRCYLRGFSRDGVIAMRLVPGDERKDIQVRDAGVRSGFYRAAGESSREASMERAMVKLETAVAPILRGPEGSWPLVGDDRATLAEFIALQVHRSPAWRRWHDGVIARVAADLARRRDPEDRPAVARAAEILSSDAQRHVTLTEQIAPVASLCGSMHWTLLVAGRPVVAASDHPVVIAPLARGRSRLARVPELGYADSFEWRFPLTCRHVLLLSWLDAHEAGPRSLAPHQARNINTLTRAQAEPQWFHHPDRNAPLLASGGPAQVAGEIHPGYGFDAAQASERRKQAGRMVREMIEDDLSDQITILSRAPAAA